MKTRISVFVDGTPATQAPSVHELRRMISHNSGFVVFAEFKPQGGWFERSRTGRSPVGTGIIEGMARDNRRAKINADAAGDRWINVADITCLHIDTL